MACRSGCDLRTALVEDRGGLGYVPLNVLADRVEPFANAALVDLYRSREN